MMIPSPSFNIVDAVLYQCRLQPPVAALCAPGAQVPLLSYARLERYVYNVCRKLAVFGLAAGEIAAVDVREPVLHVAVALALTRLGLATVSVRGNVPVSLGAAAVFSDHSMPSSGARQTIPVDLSWTEGDGTPVDVSPPRRVGGDNPCRIILTSGTTGTPKAVAVSHRLLLERIARHISVFGNRLPDCSRIFCDLSLSTSLGFQFLIYTLLRGGTYFFSGDRFEDMLEAFEQYKVQCLIASPGGLEILLKCYERYPHYESKLQVAVTGGDLLSKSLSQRIRSRVCSHLMSAYGSTEASITATAPAHTIANIGGAVGYVTPGIAVEIVDEAEQPVPPNSQGIVRVRSTFAVDRYLAHEDEATSSFRDGWFYPGDVGTLSTEKLLVITGRQKSIISVGGTKINPEVIEEAICAYEGIDECAAFGALNNLGNEEIWVAIVANEKFRDDKLREHCRAALPIQFVPVMFVLVDKLARNAMGKIERERVKSLALSLHQGEPPV